MRIRMLVLSVLLVMGCRTAGQQELFGRSPWSLETDAAGEALHVQEQVGLRFPKRAGELERTNIRVFDAQRNDVGFFYNGAFGASEPKCVYGLTVYLYPATEPIDRHLQAVRAEIQRAHPEARMTDRVLSLDREHGGTGAHAGYLSSHGVFEGVSVYERRGWFVKYRLTMGPADHACEARVRVAVADMQARGR
jgi:hypothetical protein